MINSTHSLLIGAVKESGIDSLFVAKQANIRYVTGFDGDSGYAAVTESGVHLFVNPLFIEHARKSAAQYVRIHETGDDMFAVLKSLGGEFWGSRIGFEPDVLTFSLHQRFEEAVKPSVTVPCEGIVEGIRECKTPAETDAVRKAQRIAEAAFLDTLPLLREGVEERDIALEIDFRMRRHGGERSSFDTIVAFGSNTSMPHAVPTGRKLTLGDFVLIDMGTVVSGYASDMTRTVVYGRSDARQRKVYHAVLSAQEEALARLKAGMETAESYWIAHGVLDRVGYGREFVHSLGHGVGLEVHELPRLSWRSNARLKAGSIVTVEPGVYIPGWGGVRIEDMALILEGGCENLTGMDKVLLEI